MPNTSGSFSSVANFKQDLARRDVCCPGRAFAAVECDRHVGWRNASPAGDRIKKMGVAFEILDEKRALSGINLKTGHRTWFDAGEHPHQGFGSLVPWHAVGQYPVRCEFIMEDVIPGRKRIRFMEADAAHGGRNRKRHHDVIVEGCVVIALTKMAVEMRVQFA